MPRSRSFRAMRWLTVGILVLAVCAAVIGYSVLESREHGRLGRVVFEMKASLRDLESVQEMHFGAHDTYASDACADGARCDVLGVHAPADIALSTTGTSAGWSAVATHAALPGERCDIHVGDAPTAGVSTVPGEVACTVVWP